MIECLLWQRFCFQLDLLWNGKRLSYCCAYTAFISFEFFMVYSSAYVYMFMVFMCDDISLIGKIFDSCVDFKS